MIVYSLVMSYKFCIVPLCQNTTIKTPDKIFVHVPRNEEIRFKWCKAMKMKHLKHSYLTVCEDHFDMEKDMEHFMMYKMVGGRLRVKKDVVPHKFACQKDATVELWTPERTIGPQRKDYKMLLKNLHQSSNKTKSVQSLAKLKQKKLAVVDESSQPIFKPEVVIKEEPMEINENLVPSISINDLKPIPACIDSFSSYAMPTIGEVFTVAENMPTIEEAFTVAKLMPTIEEDFTVAENMPTIEEDFTFAKTMPTIEEDFPVAKNMPSNEETFMIPKTELVEEPQKITSNCITTKSNQKNTHKTAEVSQPPKIAELNIMFTCSNSSRINIIMDTNEITDVVKPAETAILNKKETHETTDVVEDSDIAVFNNKKTHQTTNVAKQSDTDKINKQSENMPSEEESLKIRAKDEFDVYGDYVAAKMRTLDFIPCVYIQKAFEDILCEADLKRSDLEYVLPCTDTFQSSTVEKPRQQQITSNGLTTKSNKNKLFDDSGQFEMKDLIMNKGTFAKYNFNLYGKYIATRLRKLDLKSCHYVQKAFVDIFYTAESGNINFKFCEVLFQDK